MRLRNELCASKRHSSVFESGVHFEVGDVDRLPLFEMPASTEIVERLEQAFTVHERGREPSVEFREVCESPWRYAQEWAQQAVDNPGATLQHIWSRRIVFRRQTT